MQHQLNGQKRIVTYERVSSEDQRQRETILAQTAELVRSLESDASVVLVDRYVDDGVSGAIALRNRPDGGRLLRDAPNGKFEEVWVVKLDRLGRDDIDPLVVRRELEEYGIKVVAVWENIESPFEYALRVAFAAEERRTFLARSAAGMVQAAQAGRYCGGVPPLGYRVTGERHDSYLIASPDIIWADWTEADLVVRIYEWLGLEGRSCPWIARELNRLGVPTSSQAPGRGVRRSKTQPIWRAGRIRNIVINPVYKGKLHYGRRSAKKREVIVADCPALVSDDLWQAAQATLATNRHMAKNTRRINLLRSLMVCGLCGLNYCATRSRGGKTWWRCTGQTKDRGPIEGRCPSKSLDGSILEPIIWADLDGFLRAPGDTLDDLQDELQMNEAAAVAEASRQTLERALADLEERRRRLLDLYEFEAGVAPDELARRFEGIDHQQKEITTKLGEIESTDDEDDPVDEDLLAELGRQLDAGLTAEQRQQIALLLIRKITVHTEQLAGRKKRARLVVEYRFPGVVSNHADRGSSPRSA